MIEFKPLYCDRRKGWVCCKVMYFIEASGVRLMVIELGGTHSRMRAQLECDEYTEMLPMAER